MNNSSLRTADRNTHVKIVAVSLVAATLVAGIGIAARPNLSKAGLTGAPERIQASGPIIRAGKPMLTSSSRTTAIR